MAEYNHGTYGEFAESVGRVAQQSGTVAVYVGTAPVNLIRGYAKSVNNPIKLSNLADVRRHFGYSENWNAFTLCEAFYMHFNNPTGINVGPIVVINVLDPEHYSDAESVTKTLTFTKGRATIVSDIIILDTLSLANKVEGVDYSVSYDFDKGQVVIDSIGAPITGDVVATYQVVDLADNPVGYSAVIGDATDSGVYTGLGCIDLVYQDLGLIPNLIGCPGFSGSKPVYDAMIKAAAKINGHWDAFVCADIPLVNDDGFAVDNITAAIAWKETSGYDHEASKVFWPMGKLHNGNAVHGSTLYIWRQMLVDATHDGVPMETASNKAVPVVKQYFGADSDNKGFDQQRANTLNANGISTIVYWGGQWVLWGPHTAAFKHGSVTDNRSVFDVSIRMMMYVSNSFQQDHAMIIDKPMTRAMADSIKIREQEKADALAAIGALIGTPKVEFLEGDNSTGQLVEGNFVWVNTNTPTPPFKSGTLKVAYSTEGFNTYFGEVE